MSDDGVTRRGELPINAGSVAKDSAFNSRFGGANRTEAVDRRLTR